MAWRRDVDPGPLLFDHPPTAGFRPKERAHAMQMSTYLIFNGDCAEAFSFYERVLGGRIVMMHRHTQASTSASGARHRVMHARLELGEFSLMGSDAPPGDERAAGRQVYVAVSLAAGEAERTFGALSDGGRITMPFENTFWSPGFGMVVDRFGTPWMVNTDPAV